MSRAIPIVALDVPSAGAALALARSLGDSCRFYKVGSELFVGEGPAIVRALRDERGLAAATLLGLRRSLTPFLAWDIAKLVVAATLFPAVWWIVGRRPDDR